MFGLRCIRRSSFRRSHDPTPRFPPRGPPVCRSSRASTVLSGRCDFPPSIPPRFVSFAWRCRRCVRCFAPVGVTNAPPRAWACWGSASPLPKFSTETTGSPKFLGNLHCTFAGLFDPGRIRASDRSRRHDAAPVAGTSRAPALRLSRLNPPALVLAVYASPQRSPAWDARLASGCWSALPDPPQAGKVPARGFRVCP